MGSQNWLNKRMVDFRRMWQTILANGQRNIALDRKA